MSPAHADIKDTDRPKVTETHHDFGTHWVAGAPVNGGYLDWDLTDGVTTPIVQGYHYVSDQECGRVRVEYYDDDHDEIGSRNGPRHCAPGNGKTQWWVDIDSYDSATVDHVHVIVQKQKPNGDYRDLGFDGEYFD